MASIASSRTSTSASPSPSSSPSPSHAPALSPSVPSGPPSRDGAAFDAAAAIASRRSASRTAATKSSETFRRYASEKRGATALKRAWYRPSSAGVGLNRSWYTSICPAASPSRRAKSGVAASSGDIAGCSKSGSEYANESAIRGDRQPSKPRDPQWMRRCEKKTAPPAGRGTARIAWYASLEARASRSMSSPGPSPSPSV
mmetsp:Transcript_36307/g.95120  ORF Transcript_36307/g.95120 Transcript_36307/m.95120 type:complete len:200 (+) Transcript_36307:226-825(+)